MVRAAADVPPEYVQPGVLGPDGLREPGTIALRAPGSDFIEALLAELGEPLAQTSANLHGHPAATSAAELVPQIKAEADLVVDGGPASLAVPSTIVDCTGPTPRVLREGAIPAADILQPGPVNWGRRHFPYAPHREKCLRPQFTYLRPRL